MGTIAQVLSFYGNPKEIIGIEIMPDAVIEANRSARRNNLNNLHFLSGKVENYVKTIKKSPDLIILDPPREGIAPKAIKDILAFNAREIIYISCKPTSLAQDLPYFIDYGYIIDKAQCLDIFPRTANIETIVHLKLLDD
jgi:tRNA/tmRNA/rRNA uracil-C5-methylase (TrmA/RlmC/RlmD family)